MRRRLATRLVRLGGVAAMAFVPACGLSSCFVRGTRVGTPRGPRPIDELEVGDSVWSWDVERRAAVERAVGRVLRSERHEIFRIRAGEHSITGVTPEHPIYEAGARRFAPSIELSLRSRLLAWPFDGAPTLVDVGSIERLPAKGATEVWDLTIEGPEHDFFAEGLLVHNKRGPFFDAGVDAMAIPDASLDHLLDAGCFAGETRIATPNGPRRIDALRDGDRVWSWDVQHHTPVARRVAQVKATERDEVVDLRAGELTIRGVTTDHPVYVAGTRSFVQVGALTLASRVVAWLGGDPRVLMIDALTVRAERTRVFDLSIDGPEHDFFAEGILVHNKRPDSGARDAYVAPDAQLDPIDSSADAEPS